MSVLFKFMTVMLMFFLCLFVLTFSSLYCVTSLFLIPYVLNNLSISSILIFSSFTSCLLIPVCMHPESTSVCNYIFFLFFVLMLVCMFNFLSLLFYWFGIIYQFWKSLCTEVCYIVPIPNLQQNSLTCYHSFHWILFRHFYSSSYIVINNLWKYALSCHIYSTFLHFILSSAFYNSLSYIHICCS